MTKKLALC